MIKLNKLADRIFNFLTAGIGQEAKYSHTMAIDYEGCKFFIRPFVLSEIIMVSGRWEPYVKGILDKKVNRSHVIVDVGANIGIYAIPLAKKAAKVIAFEPHPKTCEILNRNVRENSIQNIVLLNKAVGESTKKVKFGLSNIPQESGILNACSHERAQAVEIDCVDLDTVLSQENRIDWLLIDVEGNEEKVITGAREILKKHSPNLIYESFSENASRVNKILVDKGYTIDQIYTIYYHAVKSRRESVPKTPLEP